MGKDDIIGVDTKEFRILGARIPLSLIAIIIVIVVFTGGMGAGSKIRDLKISDLWKGEPSTEGNFVGGVAMSIDESDYLGNVAITPTSPTFSMYYTMPVASSVGKPLAVGGDTLSVDGSGFVYFDIYGGTDTYLLPDFALMKGSNPRLTQLINTDFDNDGDRDLIAQFDVSDIGVSGQGVAPTFDMVLPVLDQDTTGITITAPTNLTALGEDELVVTGDFSVAGLTAEDGCMISGIWFTSNQTNEGDGFDLEKLSVGGGWTVKRIDGVSLGAVSSINDPINEENGNYRADYVEADDENDPLAVGGWIVYRDTDAVDELRLDVQLRHDLATNGNFYIRMNIRYVTPDGTKATATAGWNIDEA